MLLKICFCLLGVHPRGKAVALVPQKPSPQTSIRSSIKIYIYKHTYTHTHTHTHTLTHTHKHTHTYKYTCTRDDVLLICSLFSLRGHTQKTRNSTLSLALLASSFFFFFFLAPSERVMSHDSSICVTGLTHMSGITHIKL